MRRAPSLLAALFGGLAAGAAFSTEAPQDRIEHLSREAARVASELRQGAREATQVERDLAALTGDLAQLAGREAAARAEFQAKRDRLRRLLAAFISLSRAPEPALLAHPDAPLAAARATMLMERVGPALIGEARNIEASIRDIAQLRAERSASRARLEASAAELTFLRASLEAALAARTEELKAAQASAAAALEAESMTRALKAAKEIEAALGRAAAEPEQAPRRSFGTARGELTAPLSPAALSARFGEAPSGARPGAPRQGLWLQGAAHGAALAPWSGEILFAGPFRRLRNVIILEPEKGYQIVLGGLATVSGAVGDVVRAGDVIGHLDGPPSNAEEFLIEMSARPGEAARIAAGDETGPDAGGRMLYMEVRENGTPTDPAPWLRSNQKVSGL